MDVKTNHIYLMTADQKSDAMRRTLIKKGSYVMALEEDYCDVVLVQDLSKEPVGDGKWYTLVDNLAEVDLSKVDGCSRVKDTTIKTDHKYILTKDEVNPINGDVFIAAGSTVVALKQDCSKRVLVHDLSDEPNDDGIWWVDADALIPYVDLKVGDKYVMLEDTEMSNSGRPYITKGSIVEVVARFELAPHGEVLVQDLSDDKYLDGQWIVDAKSLSPLKTEEPEAKEPEDDEEVNEDEPEEPKEEGNMSVVDTYIHGGAYAAAMAVEQGKTYVMTEDETAIYDANIVYIHKGAIVQVVDTYCNEEYGRVLVQDLSEKPYKDGQWFVDTYKLTPVPAEGSMENPELNAHYISDHQPIEVMQSNMTHEELIGFLKGNIIKYACRCGKKDAPEKEAAKIKQYADWLCIVLSGGTIDPRS